MDTTSPLLRIAVTGMGLCNSLGQDIGQIWPRTLAMESGLARIPHGQPNPPHFFDAPFAPGLNSYTDVAALCSLDFTRHDLQLPPQDFASMPASTRLTLHVARQAVESSGISGAGYDPQRVGVFVSQNAGEAASTLWDLNLSLRAGALAHLAAAHGQWDDDTREAFRQSLLEGCQKPHEGSMLGRINCMAAGFLCRRYGFTGPAFSLGSACASSMAALYTALQLLRNGTIDAALIGGGEEVYAPLYMAEFTALGALARASEHIREPEDFSRPFDLYRNGFVLGEGAGMLVLEREDTARRRNAPLHGLITGMGNVTTSKGPVEPDADAQIKAVRASFEHLDYGPEAVDLVECHATSTVQGDVEEARALAATFGHKSRPTVLSAYKGQIGHTTGASGVTAIVHGLLAMRDGVYPGTRNCHEPDPALALSANNLRVCASPEAWEKPASGIRRVQVNSFAFGGACFALQMEEPNERSLSSGRTPRLSDTAAAEHSSEDSRLLYEEVVNGTRLMGLLHRGEEWRMGATTPHWRQEMTGLPVTPTAEELAALSRKGLWLHKADTPPPVAVMCCGQGSVWPGMGRALYDNFPAARAAMDRIAAVADWDILGIMDEPDVEKIGLTRWQQPYLFLLEYAQASYLESLGFKPVVMSGHSLGELIALCLAGVYTPEQGWLILNSRAQLMHELETKATRDTGMMAVHGPAEVVTQTLRDFPSLRVSNYNTPTQHILSGPRDDLTEARRVLRKQKHPAIVLNVSMAFHHPHMRVLREHSYARLSTIDMKPPRLPMFSNITTGLYPNDTPSICEYICDLDENAVRWVECVRKMWSDYGIRHFVEFGPADTLCGLTGDIEPQAVCISAGRKDKEVEGMRQAVARLHALGHLPHQPGRAGRAAPAVPDALAPAEHTARPSAPPVTPSPAAEDMPPHVEDILPLIMEATGYERHELAPDMDLRHDLAIRSSRFPMIMSAAEERFQITMRFEDLMGVATIRDLANVLARLREAPVADQAAPPPPAQDKSTAASADILPPLLRYVPHWAPVDTHAAESAPPLDAAPLLLVGDSALAHAWGEVLRQTYGQEQVRQVANAAEALNMLADIHFAPRGLALTSSALASSALDAAADPSAALGQALRLLQAFLTRREASLCLVAGEVQDSQALSPLQEGLNALLLSVALEYPRMVFRALWTGDDTKWMRTSLTRPEATPLPLVWRSTGGLCTSPQLQARSLDTGLPGLPLARGQVLVVSGGARGITPHALTGLADMGIQLALLGRSAAQTPSVEHLNTVVRCYACDVTDRADVDRAIAEIINDFGGIDGIVHAAGLNRDATLAELTPEDMDSVLAVKCRGLRHLLEAAAPHGLRYAVAFSSLAGWLGNYGQSNYSAANRAMSALLAQWCGARNLPWRVVWLPPVVASTGQEHTAGQPLGMADGEETRRQLALRGLDKAWLEVQELAPLLTRELLCGASTQVLWARALPLVPTVLPTPAPSAAARHQLAENPQSFPLVFPLALSHEDGLTRFVGGHHFSRYTDALPDTEGTALLPPALVLACAEQAARYAQPWLDVVQWTDIRFGQPVHCHGGVTRESRISARNLPSTGAAAVPVATELLVRDISANARRKDRWSLGVAGTVLLGDNADMTPLTPLWEAPAVELWSHEAAVTQDLPRQSQILRLEEIAPHSDSRYAVQWHYLLALLRHLPQGLIPESAAHMRYQGQSPKGRALLEWRSTVHTTEQWRGDVQIQHEEGPVFFVIRDLVLVRPHEGSAQ